MAKDIPAHVLYTEDHEWIRVEGDTVYIGITDYAQESLGDIVFVEVPDIDTEVAVEEEIANIESVKTAAPLYTPVAGTVIDVNDELEDAPELLNTDPYETFIVALKVEDLPDSLMDADAYKAFIG